MNEIKFSTAIIDLTDPSRRLSTKDRENFSWWSDKTTEEKHMLSLSVRDIQETLLVGIFVFNGKADPIAGAGIFKPRTWDGKEPHFNDHQVVELGTNYVLPEYRNQGIGTHLIGERLKYAKEKEWVSVSISSNEIMHRAFSKFNCFIMDEDAGKHGHLMEHLCLRCKTDRETCKCCPFAEKSAWIF